jgi:hydroxymethylpyrimidine pyrophosphatase-like HAD family hydrolase
MTTLEDEYKNIFDVGLNVIQHPSYFETALKGFSKSGGMEKVKEYFGIYKTIAIGDSKNDLDMLLHADISVAMGNGDDTVKANAHYITDTLINDGAALAMEKFLEL